MGTQLYERGVFLNRSLEEACLLKPELVRSIHEAYLEAGAEILQTHTFAANRAKLALYDLGDQTRQINMAACALAREASGGRAWVAGSVGPSGYTPGVMADDELEDLRDVFREQITYLVEGGVDLIILETFRLLSEVKVALQAAREVCALPIVAQMAFDAEEKTADGADPERVAGLLRRWGADVVGVNCVEGPEGVFRVAVRMLDAGLPISAAPNAGYPRMQDGRLIYRATPEYFGVYARRFFQAGIKIVGGCCGTSPEHIQRIANSARMIGAHANVEVPSSSAFPAHRGQSEEGLPPKPLGDKSALGAKIERVWRERLEAGDLRRPTPQNFVVSVEVNPPQGLDLTRAIEAARMLQASGVDVINIADGPRASVRVSNQALALMVSQKVGMEVILHVCCRDRNLLGLQSDLLAAHVLGLHNLVVVTGDPPKMGDYPRATGVFDLDSVGLLRLIHGLNRGIDPAGRVVGQATGFACACGADPGALDYDRELRRLELKKAAGAEWVMTQPVYDPRVLERFLDDTAHLGLPVMVGLLPLASFRNAEFLHNEVPGMQIPSEIRERMRAVEKGPAARAEGVKIAQEALLAVAHRVVGAYIMPPFERHEAALEILAPLGYCAAGLGGTSAQEA
jgi:homocysteine S-methyltransferase